jgi:hypothetical protein
MLGGVGSEFEEFEAAARKFLARGERRVDMQLYRAVIDALKRELASSPHFSDVNAENAEAEEC